MEEEGRESGRENGVVGRIKKRERDDEQKVWKEGVREREIWREKSEDVREQSKERERE